LILMSFQMILERWCPTKLASKCNTLTSCEPIAASQFRRTSSVSVLATVVDILNGLHSVLFNMIFPIFLCTPKK
jgi:hypothetical protein